MSKLAVEQRHNLRLGKNIYLIVVNNPFNEFDDSATAYLSSAEGTKGIAAAAIVAPDALGKNTGKHIIEIDVPCIRTAICDSLKHASDWLLEMMKPNPKGITIREDQVLKLWEKHFTRSAIAEKMGCAPKTVDAHTYSLKKRFNAKNIQELIKKAKDEGFLPHS
nr:LuxR C-terminal-related transcriptional regulator [Dinghuibacter silviterrae]